MFSIPFIVPGGVLPTDVAQAVLPPEMHSLSVLEEAPQHSWAASMGTGKSTLQTQAHGVQHKLSILLLEEAPLSQGPRVKEDWKGKEWARG